MQMSFNLIMDNREPLEELNLKSRAITLLTKVHIVKAMSWFISYALTINHSTKYRTDDK